MKVQSLLTELRYQLNDLEGLGYPDDLLTEFINDGLCFIYRYHPEHFAHSTVHEAVLGDVQCLGACCDRLLSVDAVCDACGNFVDMVRQGSTKQAALFDKAPINPVMRTVKLRANVNNEFAVWPPVTANEQPLYFRATCTRPPEAVRFGTDDIPGCAHHEALLNYVLYRAYAVETESQTSAALSQTCYQRCLQLLGLEQTALTSARENNERP